MDEQTNALLSDYIEGRLDETGWRDLCLCLNRDPQTLSQYVSHVMLDQQLRLELSAMQQDDRLSAIQVEDEIVSRFLLWDALEQERQAADKRKAQQQANLQHQRAEAQRREKLHRQMLGLDREAAPPARHYVIPKPIAYGAAAMFAALVIAWSWGTWFGKSTPTAPSLTTEPIAAHVEAARGAQWADGQWLEAGDPLQAGSYALEEGWVKIVYDHGAQLIVEAPADFNLESNTLIALDSGKLVGQCPTEQSRGFAVRTPSAKVVDLGTEFAVEVKSPTVTDIHVFEGKVEANFASQQLAAKSQTVAIGRDQARRFDASDPIVRAIAATPQRFTRSWDQVHAQPLHLAGDFHYLSEAPPTPELDSFDPDAQILVVCERMDQPTEHHLPVTVHSAGSFDSQQLRNLTFDRGAMIPKATRLTSYLLHLAPSRSVQAGGAITFPGKIVGVIASHDQLAATDEKFAPAAAFYRTDYRNGYARGVTDPNDGDRIEISADQRTLQVAFRCDAQVDQIRVLVALTGDEAQHAVELIGYLPDYRLGDHDYVNQVLPKQLAMLDEVRHFGIQLNKDATLRVESQQDNHLALLRKLISNLPADKQPRLVLSLGGAGESSAHLTTVAGNESLRRILADQIRRLVITAGAQGVDIDWEHPADGREINQDYPALLALIKQALEPTTTISVTVAPSKMLPYHMLTGFNAVDSVSLMTYDLSWWANDPADPNHGEHSLPLYVEDAVRAWTQRRGAAIPRNYVFGAKTSLGAPKHKLGIGAPLYARGFGRTDVKEVISYKDLHNSANAAEENVHQINGKTYWLPGKTMIADRIRYANKMGLRHVIFWELSQDLPPDHPDSLLRAAYEANGQPVVATPPGDARESTAKN